MVSNCINIESLSYNYSRIHETILEEIKSSKDFNLNGLFEKYFQGNSYESITILVLSIYQILKNAKSKENYKVLQELLVDQEFDAHFLQLYQDQNDQASEMIIIKTLNRLLKNGFQKSQEKILDLLQAEPETNLAFVKLCKTIKILKLQIKQSFNKNPVLRKLGLDIEEDNQFYQMDKKKYLVEIFSFLQNLCENCEYRFQTYFLSPENV